jgi:hypothetical protein
MTSIRPIPFGSPKTLLRPAAIWRVPSPSETATPNSVARIARMSIAFPMGPSTRSPIRGRKTVLICRLAIPLR